MSSALIETTNVAVSLTPRPIEPSWIIEGNPMAQWHVLSQSADGLASTMVWECSQGKFNWYYDFDETVLILGVRSLLENAIPCRRSVTSRVTSFLQGRRACQMAYRRSRPQTLQDTAGLARLAAI